MASLTGQTIASTYDALLKITDNGPITVSLKQITDGLGNNTPLYLSATTVFVDGNFRLSGPLYDTNNNPGTNGQILVSTGSAVDWQNLSESGLITGSGTATFIPKFTSSSAIGSSIISESIAGIGIGITATQKLHVDGNGLFTGTLTASNVSGSNTGDETKVSIETKLGVATSSNNGYLTSSDWSTFNAKQAALNGTGFVKISGTTISYDNSTYALASRNIATTAPLAGGGDLTQSRTISIAKATALADGYLSKEDWASFNAKQGALTLTVNNDSGASSLVGDTLNIPTYTLSGLGGVPSGRTITINGETYDLSANRTYSVNVGVTSFNTRTGAVVLSSSDVTTALGYTPALNSRIMTINGVGYDLSADRSWSVGTVTSVGTSAPLTGGTITGTGTIGITQSGAAADGYLSSTDWNTFNNKQNALGYTPENVANKGAINGYASLDGAGKVPSTQLPSYVDDVVEVANFAALPATGETGKIYITLDTNFVYRWSGSVYVKISEPNAVWGSITGTLSNQTDLQSALNAKVDNTRTLTINGTEYDLSANRSWSVGTVTSVSGTGTVSGLSLSGSVTGSGNLTLGGTLALTSSDVTTGLGYTPVTNARTLSINGTAFDLTANRSWNVGTVTSVGLELGTTGTDLSVANSPITSSGNITLNIPTASATNRGALSSTDWSTFNNKQNALTLTTTGNSGSATLVGATLNIPTYTLAGLGGQPLLTNPVTGTGTSGYLARWTGSTTVGNSAIFDNGTQIGIGTSSPASLLNVSGGNITVSAGSGLAWSGDQTRIITPEDNVAGALIQTPGIIRLNAGGSEKVRVTATGRVGVNTTNPGTTFHVVGGTYLQGQTDVIFANGSILLKQVLTDGVDLQLRPNAGKNGYISFTEDSVADRWSIGVSGGDSNFYFRQPYYNSTPRMTLTSGGNLGIGTTSPKSILHANGSIFSGGAGDGFEANGANTYMSVAVGPGVSRGIRTSVTSDTGFAGMSIVGMSGTFSTSGLPSTGTYDRQLLYLNGNSGNVGIGVTPSAKLHVNGGNLGNSSGNYLGSQIIESFVGNGEYVELGSLRTSAGSDWTTSGFRIQERIDSSYMGYIQFNGNSNNGGISFGTGINSVRTSVPEIMRITSAGNVGIGTSSPNSFSGYTTLGLSNPTNGAVLQFMQGSTVVGQLFNTANEFYVDSNSTFPLIFRTNSGNERMRITSAGDILIGKSAKALSSRGVEIYNTVTENGNIFSSIPNNANSYHVWDTTNGAFRFYVSGAGTIFATNTSISSLSDIRLKENVRDIDNALSKIMMLKPRVFDWKDGAGKGIKNDRGFIAQEFEEVFPDLIDEFKVGENDSDEKYKSIRQDLIPMLVKAIQEQQAQIEELKAKLK